MQPGVSKFFSVDGPRPHENGEARKVKVAKLAGAQPRANPDASDSEPRLDVGLLKSDYQIEN